jgi:two-component system LytT family response regulator
MKLTAVIADDERLARQELKRLLGEAEVPVQVIGEAANADEALPVLRATEPDILFLDIQMPGGDGFALLDRLETVPRNVIFTTAYDQYAIKAFEVNALDYLMKPIELDRLNEALRKIRQNTPPEAAAVEPNHLLSGQDQVFIKDGDRCWFVQLAHIRLFESVGNYSRVFFDDHKPLILRSLNALEKRLDERLFFRANRKHLVNLHHIAKVEPWFSSGLLLTLTDGQQVEVSRRQSGKIRDMLSL